MTVQPVDRPRPAGAVPGTAPSPAPTGRAETRAARPGALAGRSVAVLRVVTGVVFVWAFLDKLFGLSYATPSARSWLHGGSPTKGFLSNVAAGPLQSVFHSVAGTWWADTLFMLGLLAIGLALVAGVAVRAAAAAGVLMMALMWLAEFPPAVHTSVGALSGSSNPLVDYHFVYAVVLVVLAATGAGRVWGLGDRWGRLARQQHLAWAA